MPNELSKSLSPYLLQHQHNPVDWMQWSEEAFAVAKRRDVPVFLSVGYAACHWCHVMAHESFENEEVGRYLNEHFVCIKVDREERPDIDQIYMNAVQLMTGHGGWPMSVFLDHDGRPFYSGTYWPVQPRGGMPSFPQVLDALVDAWANRRDEVGSHAADITKALQQLAVGTGSPAEDVPGPDRIGVAVEGLLKSLDTTWGGFGSAPKFPHATDLDLLLRVGSRTNDTRLIDAVELTLDRMAAGGIRDHIGGGFSRYSVDGHWLVPHFEKMLYDNGLLAEVYVRAFQVTGNPRHSHVAAEILNYLQRDMIDSGAADGSGESNGGGIHCSEDADSEGVEGKFYVWKPDEVLSILGEERGARFCTIYDITDRGNFEGQSIPNLPRSLDQWATQAKVDVEDLRKQLADDCERLRIEREKRVKPGRDDKIVVAWNALAIRAFAVGAVVLRRNDFLETAGNAARFVLKKMRDESGNLLHVHRDGSSRLNAYIDDYALFADALIALYEATGDPTWLTESITLAESIVSRFFDCVDGGFFYTASDSETLITRNKDWHDGSMVSGNASACMTLLKLSRLTDHDWTPQVQQTLKAAGTVIREQARACSALIAVLDELHYHQGESVIAVAEKTQIRDAAFRVLSQYQPATTIAWAIENANEKTPVAEDLIRGKTTIDGKPTLYRCRNYHCESPEVI